jgi:hypothetical protein
MINSEVTYQASRQRLDDLRRQADEYRHGIENADTHRFARYKQREQLRRVLGTLVPRRPARA